MKKIYLFLFSIIIPLVIFGISLFIAIFYKNYSGFFYPLVLLIVIVLLVIFGIKYKIKFWSIFSSVILFIVFTNILWGIFGIVFKEHIWDKSMNKKIESGEITTCVPTPENRMGLDC